MATSVTKYRGGSVIIPGRNKSNIPFYKEKQKIWFGADKTESTDKGVELFIDYQNPAISYPTKATNPSFYRLFSIAKVNGLNVANAAPESITNIASAYTIPNLAEFGNQSCITFAFLAKSDAVAYPKGQRSLFFVGATGASFVPMIRIQFNSNTSFTVYSRHSDPDEIASSVTMNNIPAGYNFITVEMNYAQNTLGVRVNGGIPLRVPAYTGKSGNNSMPENAIGALFSYLTSAGGVDNGSQFSGQLWGMSVFMGQLSDLELKSVTDFYLDRRARLSL
ncbi:hypothetical protein AB6848_20585 [Serratia proteamaculans]|uniref:hypothetical protein n=1 Tax=Serratia proteamaculans TaxID=28151 RepID=UPI0039BDEAA3